MKTQFTILAIAGTLLALSVKAQTNVRDSLKFYISVPSPDQKGFTINFANIFINGDSVTTSLTWAPPRTPGSYYATELRDSIIAFIPTTNEGWRVNLLDLRNYKQKKSASLPISPTFLTSDSNSIFVGSIRDGRIIKLRSDLSVDTSFTRIFGDKHVCHYLEVDNGVLYAFIVDRYGYYNARNSRIFAINIYSGDTLGTYYAGNSSVFTIRNGKILVAQTSRDGKNSATIKVLNATKNERGGALNSVSFTQVGRDTSVNYFVSGFHIGLDGYGYGLFYPGQLGKFNLSDGTLVSTQPIQAQLPSMTLPFKMFTTSTKAIIFWRVDGQEGYSQVVVSNLNTPDTILGAQNTGISKGALILLNK